MLVLILPVLRTWMSWLNSAPAHSGRRGRMASDNCTCYSRVLEFSRMLWQCFVNELHMMSPFFSPFSHSDMVKVKAVFKRMLAESHAKVSGSSLPYSVKPQCIGHSIRQHLIITQVPSDVIYPLHKSLFQPLTLAHRWPLTTFPMIFCLSTSHSGD